MKVLPIFALAAASVVYAMPVSDCTSLRHDTELELESSPGRDSDPNGYDHGSESPRDVHRDAQVLYAHRPRPIYGRAHDGCYLDRHRAAELDGRVVGECA